MKFKNFLLLSGFIMVLASCTTAYKTGQTPDDVYSSPAPPEEEYVKTKKTDERRYRNYDDEEYEDYDDYDDRYLRMKVRNRNRWSELDDWYFYGGRYNFSYYNNWGYWNDPFYWNNPWSPVSYWNAWYSPYWSNWGWGGGFGWGGMWGNPWYNSWGWGAGWGGMWGGYYGGWGGMWGNPWYNGWYGGWGYGPGIIAGRNVSYGPRTSNLGSYSRGTNANSNRSTMQRAPANSYNRGYTNTYGVRSNSSVNTNTRNSSLGARAASRRFGSTESYNNSRTFRNQTYSPRSESRTYSPPSNNSGGSFGGSSGGSRGGGGGAAGRRF